MTTVFKILQLLFLLAIIIPIKTENQSISDGYAEVEEEEEAKINNVGKSELILNNTSGSNVNNDDLVPTEDDFPWIAENDTDRDALHKEEEKKIAENSAEYDFSDEMHSTFDNHLKNDSTALLNNIQPNGNPNESPEKETSIFNITYFSVPPLDDSNCTVGEEKCVSDSVELDEKPKDKMPLSTLSETSSPPSRLWSAVKASKTENPVDDTLESHPYFINFTRFLSASNPQTLSIQTSENLIQVETETSSKSVSGIQSDALITSIQVKQTKTADTGHDSIEDRHFSSLLKTKFPSDKNYASSTYESDITSSLSNSKVSFSDFIPEHVPELLFSDSKFSSGLDNSVISPTLSSSIQLVTSTFTLDSPQLMSVIDSYFQDTGEKSEGIGTVDVTDILKKLTIPPRLFSSFREISPYTNVKTTETLSSSFVESPVLLSSTLHPVHFDVPPYSSTLEPQLNSPSVEKETTRAHTSTSNVKDNRLHPPSLSYHECSSLPICIEITLLETSWEEFCSRSYEFREFLSKIVSRYTRPIYPRHFIIDERTCDSLTDSLRLIPDVVVTFYVTDEYGEYDESLTEICGVILRKSTTFRNSAMEVRQFNGDSLSTPIPLLPVINSGFIAAVSISAVAGVALCMLCVLLVVMKQKLLQNRHSDTTTPTADSYSLDSLSINASFRRRRVRRSGRSYLNHAFNDQEFASHPLNEKSLANCLKNKELLEDEFKRIPMNMPKLEQIPDGAEVKNRYSNILPKPETRVMILEPSEDPLKTYINANYVKGYGGKADAYIACQAPLPEGIEDFWRMVWEQQCRLIIMLTMFEENGIARCAQYFPQSTLVSYPPYGEFQVSLLKKDVYEFYTMSTLRLLDLEKNLFRDVIHFWYTSWPDVGVPKDPSNLVIFMMQCRSFMNCNSGPTVVHCSTGTGRTGMFIALDLCMREYDDSRSIDVLQAVTQIRKERAGAVQNKDQYILIYEAMIEYVSQMANQSQRPSIRSNS